MTAGMMPGRAVDLVSAACAKLGLHPYTINARFDHANEDGTVRVNAVLLHCWENVTEPMAAGVFAALGVTATGVERLAMFPDQGILVEVVPVLGEGVTLSVTVTKLPPIPVPDPSAVVQLVDQVDAARAEQDAESAHHAGVADRDPDPNAWRSEPRLHVVSDATIAEVAAVSADLAERGVAPW